MSYSEDYYMADGGNRNKEVDRREIDGVTYFDRGDREADGKLYKRLAVQTHFIGRGEDYIAVIKQYILPVYQAGDMVMLGEKAIAMCQDNTVEKKDVKIGFWAKFLSRFASRSKHGVAMDEPYKLQLAIDLKGLPRILLASILGGICRIFGKRGVFYDIAGKDIAGIDGFYAASSFEIYHDLAVLVPKDPDGVCAEIEREFSMASALVDANDLDIEILGRSPSLSDKPEEFLAELIRDNPAGQSDELTPFVIVREIREVNGHAE
jgi:hypothetical protein